MLSRVRDLEEFLLVFNDLVQDSGLTCDERHLHVALLHDGARVVDSDLVSDQHDDGCRCDAPSGNEDGVSVLLDPVHWDGFLILRL